MTKETPQLLNLREMPQNRIRSSVFLFTLVLSNVEISQLIDIPVLVGCNHPKPVPHVVLFQVLLGQIFQIPERCDEMKICKQRKLLAPKEIGPQRNEFTFMRGFKGK